MAAPLVKSSLAVKVPSSDDIFEIWQRDTNDIGLEGVASMIYEGGEGCTLEELPARVQAEIDRVHRDVGEDTKSYAQHARGDVSHPGPDVVFDLPTDVIPHVFPLARSHNGAELCFTLTAYRKGHNPDDQEANN